jgi:hypothetical protein
VRFLPVPINIAGACVYKTQNEEPVGGFCRWQQTLPDFTFTKAHSEESLCY